MLIAVEGCCHGELDNIYASLALAEQRNGVKVDLLLICGDFQAVRNPADLAGLACPPKYRAMQTFYKYYSGEKVAPVLTVFIGGNHEASAHLNELFHGGWAAPNIYFLGFAGVVNVGGVRIGGLSGIFNGRHYSQGHHECPPFSDDTMRSVYHIRELEVFKLRQLGKPLDIFLSHDWPQHIAKHGNTQKLFRRKAFLQSEVADGSLGSPPARELLDKLQPRYWFSAHLHTKFAAVVHHAGGAATKFLSLDKCLPNRDFLQLLELPGDGSAPTLAYDAEWLAILSSTWHLHSCVRGRVPLDPVAVAAASGGRGSFAPSTDEERAVAERAAGGSLAVPLNFSVTAPPYVAGQPIVAPQAPFNENPQTTAFLQTFGLGADFRSQRGATHGAAGAAHAAAGLPPAASGGLFSAMPPMPAADEEIDLGDD